MSAIRRTILDYLFMALLAAASVAFVVVILTRQETASRELLTEIRNSSRATACVLALPQNEDGRDPVLVAACFADNGLRPPAVP